MEIRMNAAAIVSIVTRETAVSSMRRLVSNAAMQCGNSVSEKEQEEEILDEREEFSIQMSPVGGGS
jgi:hypothetical protein